MKHESYENVFEVEETQESFSDWLNKPYISSKLRKQLVNANLLIVPLEGVQENVGPVFPNCTEELCLFLKENATADLVPEICIEDQDFTELVMHWDLFTVGSIIVKCIVAPFAVNLIYDYLKDRLGPRASKTHVKLELTVVQEDGKAAHMLYEGPSKELRKTLLPAIENLSKK